jgi:hypothetical protein
MRIIQIIAFIFVLATNGFGQDFKIDVAYKYLFANNWDKAIQTYNFSRPFLLNKQPIFENGLNASATYLFKSAHYSKQGIILSYSYFGSLAENENFANKLNLHFLNLGYLIHFGNPDKSSGVYADFILSATSSALFRNVNGEPLIYDETTSKAYGIGVDMALKLGNAIGLKNKNAISPFVSLSLSPYLYSPNAEAVLNQTKGLVGEPWLGLLTGQVGLSFCRSSFSKE